MTDDEDEKLLVLRVQCGDIAAFESILMRLHKPLRSYVILFDSQCHNGHLVVRLQMIAGRI
jgi:hypothetical protein